MIKFNLKNIMKQKNVNISQLNEKTGISRNSLSLLINGKSQGIQFETIDRITRALNIEVEELFERSFNELKIELSGLFHVENSITYSYLEGEDQNEKLRSNEIQEYDNSYNYIALGCKYIVDGNESEALIPYNFCLEFNSNIKFRLDIQFKNSELKNDFIYLFDNVYSSSDLLIKYIARFILEKLKNNHLEKIKNNFDTDNIFIEITDDINHRILRLPLDETLSLSRDYLESGLEELNKKSVYKITFDNALIFENKQKVD